MIQPDDKVGYCAHLRVQWKTELLEDGFTHGWWECDSCVTHFGPVQKERIQAEQERASLAIAETQSQNQRVVELEAQVASLTELLTALVKYVPVFKPEDFPETCGACGTPAASCDTGCMGAAYMAEQNGAVRRAQQLLAGLSKRAASPEPLL